MPFVGALKEKLDKTDAKVKILKQIIFIQFYIWFLDTQVGAKKALSIKQLQNIKKLFDEKKKFQEEIGITFNPTVMVNRKVIYVIH